MLLLGDWLSGRVGMLGGDAEMLEGDDMAEGETELLMEGGVACTATKGWLGAD